MKTRLNPFAAALLPLTAPGLAFAGPSGGQVVTGVDSITSSGNTTTVVQNAQNAIVNWTTFSVGGEEVVVFNQPSASAAILNRVVGGMPSEILGQISANGRVFLVNPSGIVFGQGSSVNVGSLVASTLDLTDEDFLSDIDTDANSGYLLGGDASSSAAVTNAGSIVAADGGFVVLAASDVRNSGLIQARLGEVLLAGGSQLTLTLGDAGLVGYAIDGAALGDAAGVQNLGTITAQGGTVIMAAAVARALIATVVNNQGTISATGITEDGGEVYLTAAGGHIDHSGTLTAAGPTAAQGGTVTVQGDHDLRLAGGLVAGDVDVNAGGALAVGSSGGASITGHDVLLVAGGDIGVAGAIVGSGDGEAVVRSFGGDIGLADVSADGIFIEAFDGRVTAAALVSRADVNVYSGNQDSSDDAADGYGGFAGSVSGIAVASASAADELVLTTDYSGYGGSGVPAGLGISTGALRAGRGLALYDETADVSTGAISVEAAEPAAGTYAYVNIVAHGGSMATGPISLDSGGSEAWIDLFASDGIRIAGDLSLQQTATTPGEGGTSSYANIDLYAASGDVTVEGDLRLSSVAGANAFGQSTAEAYASFYADTGSLAVDGELAVNVSAEGADGASTYGYIDLYANGGAVHVGGLSLSSAAASSAGDAQSQAYIGLAAEGGDASVSGSVALVSTALAAATGYGTAYGEIDVAAYSGSVSIGGDLSAQLETSGLSEADYGDYGGYGGYGGSDYADVALYGYGDVLVSGDTAMSLVTSGAFGWLWLDAVAEQGGLGLGGVSLSGGQQAGAYLAGWTGVSVAGDIAFTQPDALYGVYLELVSDAGDVSTRSIGMTGTATRQLGLYANGDVLIDGMLSLESTGGGSSGGESGASGVYAGLGAGGAMAVTGAVSLIAAPATYAYLEENQSYSSASSGRHSDAYLYLYGASVGLGGDVHVEATGWASLQAYAQRELTIAGNTGLVAHAAEYEDSYADAYGSQSSSERYGAASLWLYSENALPEGQSGDALIDTGDLSVSGPNAYVSVTGAGLALGDADAATAALSVTALPADAQGGAYYSASRDGAPVVESSYAQAVATLDAFGAGTGGPVLSTQGGLQVSGPSALLALLATRDMNLGGGIAVTGSGYSVSGDWTVLSSDHHPRYSAQGDGIWLDQGSTAWGEAELVIAGSFDEGYGGYGGQLSAAAVGPTGLGAGDVTIGGAITIAGIGEAGASIEVHSLDTAAIAVDAAGGTLQGQYLETGYTANGVDYYDRSHTIGDGAGGAARYGRAELQLRLAADGSLSSGDLALRGLSAEGGIEGGASLALGDVLIAGADAPADAPVYDEVTSYAPASAGAPAQADTTTHVLGDINAFSVAFDPDSGLGSGAFSAGSIEVSGIGFTGLAIAAEAIATGAITLSAQGGVFTSDDSARYGAAIDQPLGDVGLLLTTGEQGASASVAGLAVAAERNVYLGVDLVSPGDVVIDAGLALSQVLPATLAGLEHPLAGAGMASAPPIEAAAAAAAVTVTPTPTGDLVFSAPVIAAGGDVAIRIGADSTLDALTVSAGGSASLDGQGHALQTGALHLQGQALRVEGLALAAEAALLTATAADVAGVGVGALTLAGTQLQAGSVELRSAGGLQLQGSELITDAPLIEAVGRVALVDSRFSAGIQGQTALPMSALAIDAGALEISGSSLLAGTIALNSAGAVSLLGGSLVADAIAIDAVGDLSLGNAVAFTAPVLDFSTAGRLAFTGSLSAAQSLSLAAAQGLTLGVGSLLSSAQTELTSSGGGISLSSTRINDVSGTGNGSVRVSGASLALSDADIAASTLVLESTQGDVGLTSGSSLVQTAGLQLRSAGDLSLSDSVSLGALQDIDAAGAVTLADAYFGRVSAAALESSTSIGIGAGGNLQITGTELFSDQLSLDAAQALTLSGSRLRGTGATLAAGSIAIGGSSRLNYGNAVALTSRQGSIDIAQTDIAAVTLSMDAAQDLGYAVTSLSAFGLDLAAGGALSLTSAATIALNAGAALSGAQVLIESSGGDLSLVGARVDAPAAGSATLRGRAVQLTEAHVAAGTLTLAASAGDLTVGGSALTATQALTGSASGNIVIGASTLDGGGHRLAAGSALTLSGVALSGSVGDFAAEGDVLIQALDGARSELAYASALSVTSASGSVTLVDSDILPPAESTAKASGGSVALSARGALLLRNASLRGNALSLRGESIALENSELSGGVVQLIASGGSVSDAGLAGSSIQAEGLGVQAGSRIDLLQTPLAVGSAQAGLGADAALLEQLADEGLAPDSAGPNAAFIAPAVALGSLSMSGDYFYAQADSLDITRPAGPDDLLLHLRPFSNGNSVGVEGAPSSQRDLNLVIADDPGSNRTFVVGGSDFEGSIYVGENGPVDALEGSNVVLATKGSVFNPSRLVTSGQVVVLEGASVVDVQQPRAAEELDVTVGAVSDQTVEPGAPEIALLDVSADDDDHIDQNSGSDTVLVCQ